MESVDLDFCDFLECEIEELGTEEEFINKQIGDKQAKGIVLQIDNTGPDPQFMYPPVHIKTTEEYIEWKNEQMKSRDDLIPSYHLITKYNNQRVKRSKSWFNNVKSDLKRTLDIITHLQESEENFNMYKKSIHDIKSKKFYERYEKTECEIQDDDSTFILEESNISTDELDTINEESSNETSDDLCLID